MFRAVLSAGLFLAGTAAQAELSVRFIEGAPKDRFDFTNNSECALRGLEITLDLSASQGGLIFDVTGAGAGVSVFQPFEVVEGAQALRAAPEVSDGDTGLTLQVGSLEPGDTIAFTIDVDDTIGSTATLIGEAEIKGAGVIVAVRGQRISGYFGDGAHALIALPPCPAT